MKWLFIDCIFLIPRVTMTVLLFSDFYFYLCSVNSRLVYAHIQHNS